MTRLLLFVSCFLIPVTSIGAERPNILFLFADDQRDHILGCAGHPAV